MSSSGPILQQAIRWGERYVSSALNRKFYGILPTGVYHGFRVKAAGAMLVSIEHDEDFPKSIAVIERGPYSITVTMDDAGYVSIPAAGTWYIVIEALYLENQTGYQRVVARESVEDYHVVLATVTVADDSVDVALTDDAISEDARQDSVGAGEASAEAIAAFEKNIVDFGLQLVRLANRVTAIEVQYFGHSFDDLPDTTSVGVVAVSPSNTGVVDGAALSFLIEDAESVDAPNGE